MKDLKKKEKFYQMTTGNCYSYPCPNCIVKACCKDKCVLHYQFINFIADHIGRMTADEIHEFGISTPLEFKKKVEA